MMSIYLLAITRERKDKTMSDFEIILNPSEGVISVSTRVGDASDQIAANRFLQKLAPAIQRLHDAAIARPIRRKVDSVSVKNEP